MKKLARKIDVTWVKIHTCINTSSNINSNINCNKINIDNFYFFSMEWFVEILMSLAYWSQYRYFILSYIPNLGWDQVFHVLFLHLLSEISQSTIRLSEFYFNQTQKLQHWFVIRYKLRDKVDKLSIKVRFRNWIIFKFIDGSTFDQWVMRCSVDIMIRFFVCVISGIHIIIYITAFGASGFSDYWKTNNYNHAIYVTIVSTATETLYFLLLYIGFHFFHKDQNIVNNYQYLTKYYKRDFVLSVLVSWMLVGTTH